MTSPAAPDLLCDRDRSVLVVVDIQPRLTAVMPAKVLARLQRNTVALIRAAGMLDVPVFATEQYPRGLGHLEPDIASILPDTACRYEKTSFSCTGADRFSEDLNRSGRNQVILTGMETHVCVLQTALNLLQDGFQVIIAADAVCSRHRDSYEIALHRMETGGGIISDTESVLFEWLRDAGHARFKQIQALIK